ncbi:beta strand repeat-containing protein [Candidatus Nitrosotenuis cloacae]|uniref:Uncharacterized protein n=1 Tax=Candidatus Nitrosotenuis cloacae TaxID=1603555 RepID=A0A3G1B2D7_9ARCH|nr:hypothetical protein [Candidatus Nitrosotenuis cloacae]AJZ75756.1 hypothetical protein SU86_004550 [Candidatus Nitrosotenuis cloacae]
MNNEIGRKLTSLTLMTIMLAAGFSAFAPSTMPEAAAANANLFVSAENSQFQNYIAGPMVTEVVVIDSDIKDTDKAKGEPDVTINGNKLRMVQASDGNWYGYFADKAQALRADAIQYASGVGGNGEGLDFGTFCSRTTGWATISFTQTVGVAFPFTNTTSVTNTGTNTFEWNGNIDADGSTSLDAFTCDAPVPGSLTVNNTGVLRENKQVNLGTSTVKVGNIGINSTSMTDAASTSPKQAVIDSIWPFIQLYNFNPTGNVVVQYNKGGGVQSTTLKFDTVDSFAKTDLDRTSYPLSSQVHATITDLQLNIDPTDEDSWTFGTLGTNATTFYGIFNEDGALATSTSTDTSVGLSKALTGNLTKLMFEDNGVMKVNRNAQSATKNVLQLQDNADSIMTSGPNGFVSGGKTTITSASQPVTITESGPNTGIFGTYDESDTSVLAITTDAPRGKSATIEYNQASKSIVVGFGFASVDIAPIDAEWNSGEEIPVTVTDSDANKNSRTDEDLDNNNADVPIIPALQTGDPFTLGEAGVESSTVTSAMFLSNLTGTFTGAQHASSGSFLNGFGSNGTLRWVDGASSTSATGAVTTVQKYSERALLNPNATSSVTAIVIDFETTGAELLKSIRDPRATSTSAGSRFHGFNLVNIDIRGISPSITNATVYLLNNTSTRGILTSDTTSGQTNDDFSIATGTKYVKLATNVSPQSISLLNGTNLPSAQAAKINELVFDGVDSTDSIGLLINFTRVTLAPAALSSNVTMAADLFSFGYIGDGLTKENRVNNQIVRIEAEETGDNTSIFGGTLEFVMLNQLNILDRATYTGLSTVADDPSFVVHQDLDDEEAPRVNYNDLAADGTITQVSDQEDAPTHSGVVSFDKPTYKKADTVTVTLEDQDLNTDVDLIDIYTAVNSTNLGAEDAAQDTIGATNLPTLTNGDALGRLLDITFDDARWKDTNNACATSLRGEATDVGLTATGFTLIETGSATGIFTGDFIIPGKVCNTSAGLVTSPVNAQGLDMEVNYVDFRDASGQIVEVGDGAGIRANTGSISLDRTVYPVPFGSTDDFATSTSSTPSGRSIFPVHLTGITASGTAIAATETLGDGPLTIHVQVNDPDFDTSATGEDKIAEGTAANSNRGPVKVTVSRGQDSVVLAYAGLATPRNGEIDVGGNNSTTTNIRDLGPITETAPTSGIFEFDLDISYTDGPSSTTCPTTTLWDSLNNPGTRAGMDSRFDAVSSTPYCILQGDIITVEYTDPADASGDTNTVTDSATFDLRNGALQSDKSVYIIGSDMILTLIEPDFDLDNDLAETYDLDLIEWDSDADTLTMGNLGGTASNSGASFDPEPSDLRETGDSTGIYQTVIEIPETLGGDKLERGEEIVLEFTDWGPSGSDYVGQEDEDVNLTIFTSNFGATVELDQKVYTWTDKVYITVVAPDQNFDSNLIDEIGESTSDPLKVATRGFNRDNYKLVETGTDTGIFTGEVILTGFTSHDADGDGTTSDAPGTTSGSGPTDGLLSADDDDGLTVSYEFSEDETVVGSALIRWNIGEVAWLEASYPASGTGVVRVIDPDMNLNPEAVDNFNTDVWSDSDAGGIDLTVTETNEATGIFEGTVFFTTTDESSGHRLRVAEGDTVTAEYQDNTLPDPYTTADELDITGTAFIGTVVPPLERAPASNARVVDAFGNTLDEVSVDQQVQITADLTNGQDREQPFAYLVQVQDENGVTVSLAWITGSLSAGQSFSPALSWIATAPGTYTATVFVWESVDNPTALSPPVSVDITVS